MKPACPLSLTALACLLLFTACGPQTRPQPPQPAVTAAPATASAATAAPATASAATAAPTQAPALASPTVAPSRQFTAAPLIPEAPTEAAGMNVVPLPTPLDSSMAALAERARQDLSKRLSLDPAQIELVEASMVTWPDSSLGCPQPGMMYTQSLVDGYRLRFKAGGKVYAYHGGGSRAPFLCGQEP